jgi:hypothetical protein
MDVISSSYSVDVLYINKLIIFISFSISRKFKSCHNINYVPFANVRNGTWNKNPTQNTPPYVDWVKGAIRRQWLDLGNPNGLDVVLLCSKLLK